MAKVEPARNAEPRLFRQLKQDLRTMGDALRREGLRPVGRTFRDLQEFYLSTERKERLAGMHPLRRWIYFSAWTVKSLFLKLTPARRVLLVLGLLVVLSSGRVQVTTGQTEIAVNTPVTGILLILFVLMLELKDKLLARDELEAGRAVQVALLPDRAPQVAGWDTWLYTQSANDVGGDLVDWLTLDDRRTAVTLGDVAGKGLPAALLMAKLQATIRAFATEFPALGEIGVRVNRIIDRDGLPNSFATWLYLVITSGSPVLRWVNAGHMPPLLVGSGAPREVERGGPALGLIGSAEYQEQVTELGAEEAFVIYSDGISEAMNRAGDFFGDDRLRATLSDVRGLTAEQIGRRVLASVAAFVGDAPPHDDVSLVVVRRVGPRQAP
jgi:hypothetical protein